MRVCISILNIVIEYYCGRESGHESGSIFLILYSGCIKSIFG